MNKVLSFILVLCLGLSLAACGGTPTQPVSTNPPASGSSGGNSGAGTPATTTAADNKITLDFWHIWGSGDSNSIAVSSVIADFQKEHPNIVINVQTFENESYKTTIRTNVSGNTAPDIFSTWGGGFSRAFVDSGKLLRLDDYLKDGTLDRLVGGALTNFTYNDHIYGLTFGMSVSGLFCNERLFNEYNLSLPTTWDELMKAVDVFQANGIIPITTSIRERWVIGMLFEAIALKAVGAEHTYNTLNKIEDGTFSDPQFLNAANRIMELLNSGAFNPDAAAISRDEAEVPLKNGRAAMYYMGSWAAGTVEEDDTLDKGNFSWIPFPLLPDGNGKRTEFNGGAADGIVVSANTAHPAEAAMFVKYFTENLAERTYQAGNYLPMWKNVQVDESQINPMILAIVRETSTATDFILWWDNLLEGRDVSTYQDALDSMLLKQTTPQQFIDSLKRIQP